MNTNILAWVGGVAPMVEGGGQESPVLPEDLIRPLILLRREGTSSPNSPQGFTFNFESDTFESSQMSLHILVAWQCPPHVKEYSVVLQRKHSDLFS